MSMGARAKKTEEKRIINGIEHNPGDPYDYARQWFYNTLNKYSEKPIIDDFAFLDEYMPRKLATLLAHEEVSLASLMLRRELDPDLLSDGIAKVIRRYDDAVESMQKIARLSAKLEVGRYRKKGSTMMQPWYPGMDLESVSVSEADKKNGSPKHGDMIATNDENPEDRWLVSAEYFARHYEEA
jgi:hypothetical protein